MVVRKLLIPVVAIAVVAGIAFIGYHVYGILIQLTKMM
jgi:hypothetical protein